MKLFELDLEWNLRLTVPGQEAPTFNPADAVDDLVYNVGWEKVESRLRAYVRAHATWLVTRDVRGNLRNSVKLEGRACLLPGMSR